MTFESLEDPAAPIDPAFVTCLTKSPTGEELFQTVSYDGEGEFHAEVLVTSAGQWRYRFETASPVRVREGSFVVRKSLYGPSSPPPIPTTDAWGEGNWGQFPWPIDTSTSPWGGFPWGQDSWG